LIFLGEVTWKLKLFGLVIILHVVLPFLFGGVATSTPALKALVHSRGMLIIPVLQHSVPIAKGLGTQVAFHRGSHGSFEDQQRAMGES
jgi:hypothetical protein